MKWWPSTLLGRQDGAAGRRGRLVLDAASEPDLYLVSQVSNSAADVGNPT